MTSNAAVGIAGTLVSLLKPPDESERPTARSIPSLREAIAEVEQEIERAQSEIEAEMAAIRAEMEGLPP